MRIAIAVFVVGTGCTEPDLPVPEVPPPREPYGMVKTKAIAGERPVYGIDGDGDGGLWIAYHLENDMSLVHLDEEGRKLVEYVWASSPLPLGIARDGDTMWINLRDDGDWSSRTLRQIDLATGTTLRTIPETEDIIDIDVFGEELRLGTFDGRVIALDRTTGTEMWEATLIGAPENFTGTARGFTTADDGVMWMMAPLWGYALAKYTPEFQGVGLYTAAPLDGHHTTAFEVFLAWDNGLIAATENQISWLVPRGEP